MLGSVYAKTLRDLRGQMAVWSAGLFVLGAANVLVIPTIQQMPGLVAFLENLPPLFKSLTGDVSTMVTPAGFLRIKLLDPLPLLLALFGVTQGAHAVAGELETRTIDLLLAQPIRRWRVVADKFLAIATVLALLCLVLAVSLMTCGLLIGLEIRAGHLLLATLAALPLSWLFAALALLGSCALPRARQAAVTAGVVVVASYTLETFALLSPVVARWRALSLFHHHKAGFDVAGQLAAGHVLLLLGLAVLAVVAALIVFDRRDLTA
jgi:ABC-2 type transport system permease protein